MYTNWANEWGFIIECMLDYGTLSADEKKLKLVCHGLGTYDIASGLYAFHNEVNYYFKDEALSSRTLLHNKKRIRRHTKNNTKQGFIKISFSLLSCKR